MKTQDFILFLKQWKNLTYDKKVQIFESAYGIEPEFLDEFYGDITRLIFAEED